MTCPACHRETSPVQIGSGQYCAKCGQRFESKTGSLPASRSRGMDISAVRHPQVVRTEVASPTAKRAHSTSNAIDLRAMKPLAKQEAHPIITPKPQRLVPKQAEHHLDDERLVQAKEVRRSTTISRFGTHQASNTPKAESKTPAVELEAKSHHMHGAAQVLPSVTTTHHEALTRLIETTKSETHFQAKSSNRRGRVVATAAAIAIMSGYIWLQNYPKMAVQSASNRSGISASLPGYLPTSYSLASTDVQAGVVTLAFKSPSQAEQLTIKQNRTSWDSASLLDNFVSSTANEYSSIQQQGLTVYLMNNNVATWVNHGIWYTISGTGRLSRDQILKIAYSL